MNYFNPDEQPADPTAAPSEPSWAEVHGVDTPGTFLWTLTRTLIMLLVVAAIFGGMWLLWRLNGG